MSWSEAPLPQDQKRQKAFAPRELLGGLQVGRHWPWLRSAWVTPLEHVWFGKWIKNTQGELSPLSLTLEIGRECGLGVEE